MNPTDFYTPGEAARVLGYCRETLRHPRWRARCQAVRWGNVYLFPRAVVDAIAAGQRELAWRDV